MALTHWRGERTRALDDLILARRAVAARAAAVEQVDRAHLVLLAAHFQGFCRDLHTEVVNAVVGAITPAAARTVVRLSLSPGPGLSRGNARPEVLTRDFGMLGLADLWNRLRAVDPAVAGGQQVLNELYAWRNAIAHDDFSTPFFRHRERVHVVTSTRVGAGEVEHFRAVCDRLCTALDSVAGRHVEGLVGRKPW